MKGVVSAQKAPQGSETETRELLGGTEERSKRECIQVVYKGPQISDKATSKGKKPL